MTSILSKMSNLRKAADMVQRVQMTDLQMEQCKEHIRKKNLGPNVHPNRFDLHTPYRVAVNFNREWNNFGNFKSADVAAAVGSIVSVAYFGNKAVAGEFNQEKVDLNPEFIEWMNDARNKKVIAQANGEQAIDDSGDNFF